MPRPDRHGVVLGLLPPGAHCFAEETDTGTTPPGSFGGYSGTMPVTGFPAGK